MDPKKRFFLKKAHDFELLKQVTESSHQTVFFGRNQYIGTLILSQSAFLRSVVYLYVCVFFCMCVCLWLSSVREL